MIEVSEYSEYIREITKIVYLYLQATKFNKIYNKVLCQEEFIHILFKSIKF